MRELRFQVGVKPRVANDPANAIVPKGMQRTSVIGATSCESMALA
jgi:hypothetical protein